MIRYDGRANRCFVDRQRGSAKYPDGCDAPCVVRVETRFLVMHLCEAHRGLMGDSVETETELTGDDWVAAQTMDADELFRTASNVLEVNGVTRAEWAARRATPGKEGGR